MLAAPLFRTRARFTIDPLLQAVTVVGGFLGSIGLIIVAAVNRASNKDGKLQELFGEYTKNLRADIATFKDEVGRLQGRVHTLEQEALAVAKERITEREAGLKVERERDDATLLATQRAARILELESDLAELKRKYRALLRRISGDRQNAPTGEALDLDPYEEEAEVL